MLGKKIMIIGCCGSGKSTLAKQLAKCIDLPLIHLDSEYWKPGWERPPKNEWEKRVKHLCTASSWVMDGNYFSTLSIRLAHADTVIFLDLNKFLCTYRVIKRALSSKQKVRSDMAQGCEERIDIEFIRFVWNFNKTMRPRIYELLESYPQLKIIVLSNSEDIKRLLKSFANNQLVVDTDSSKMI